MFNENKPAFSFTKCCKHSYYTFLGLILVEFISNFMNEHGENEKDIVYINKHVMM